MFTLLIEIAHHRTRLVPIIQHMGQCPSVLVGSVDIEHVDARGVGLGHSRDGAEVVDGGLTNGRGVRVRVFLGWVPRDAVHHLVGVVLEVDLHLRARRMRHRRDGRVGRCRVRVGDLIDCGKKGEGRQSVMRTMLREQK